eukprot:4261758-Lingulodinium_polyedra.AAC.1
MCSWNLRACNTWARVSNQDPAQAYTFKRGNAAARTQIDFALTPVERSGAVGFSHLTQDWKLRSDHRAL